MLDFYNDYGISIQRNNIKILLLVKSKVWFKFSSYNWTEDETTTVNSESFFKIAQPSLNNL